MKVPVGAFNHEKAFVGAFFVIVKLREGSFKVLEDHPWAAGEIRSWAKHGMINLVTTPAQITSDTSHTVVSGAAHHCTLVSASTDQIIKIIDK